MRETLEVFVRGKVLSDWKSVSVSRSLDTASGQFEISSPARAPYPLAPGDAVEIYAGEDLLLRGHADLVERSIGSSEAGVRIAGRDNTADLVDCSAADNPSEWADILLPALVRSIAFPFNVAVDDLSAPKAPFEIFHLRPGDTAWALIERACRLRGVLCYSDGTGRLVLREPGRDISEFELVLGDNLSAARFTGDDSQRFSTYTVRGQRTGSDAAFGDIVARVEGSATDAGARGGRHLVVIAESTVTNQTAQERAQWEASVRAANAVRFDATLKDWRKDPSDSKSPLWAINELVAVRAAELSMDGYLLVRTVTLTQDETGQSAELSLVRRDAYQPQPDLSLEDDALKSWLEETTDLESEPDDVEVDDGERFE
jgi:prophage tail gpP-like protein